MGSDRIRGTRLAARCSYGACFGLGFAITTVTLAAMFWIVWCYFGLTIIQFSDTQRRGAAGYSYTSSKPSPTPPTSSSRRTAAPVAVSSIEPSINSISKSSTSAAVLRGSSRGESEVKFDKRKESAIAHLDSSLAKGDFAARDRAIASSRTLDGALNTTANSTVLKALSIAVTASPQGPTRTGQEEENDRAGQKAAILSGDETSREVSGDDHIYARRVSESGTENRPDTDKKDEPDNRPARRNPSDQESVPRLDIVPTQAYDYDAKSGRSRRPGDVEIDRPSRDETRATHRDYADKVRTSAARRDDIQSSRRPDPDPAFRDPYFDRDYPRSASSSAARNRPLYAYDDDDDDRGSRPRFYDRRDRGRDSDDRYSKGDTRVYPDDDVRPLGRERVIKPIVADEDRYRERLAEDRIRDDRYRERLAEDRIRDDRYLDRYPEDRIRDDRYLDRYPEDTRRRGDDDKYRGQEYDGRYKDRDDRYRYRSTDENTRKERPADDRYRDDDRRRYRDDDDKYRSRDDDRNRDRTVDDRTIDKIDDDRSRDSIVDDRTRHRIVDERTRDRTFGYSERDDKDRYRSRVDRDRHRGEDLPVIERNPLPARSDDKVHLKDDRSTSDYDPLIRERPRPIVRDDEIPSKVMVSEDRYRDRDRGDDYRRPTRNDDRDDRIVPTRVRDEAYLDRPTIVDTRNRDEAYISKSTLVGVRPRDDTRYADDRKDSRPRDETYYEDDDRRSVVRVDSSKSILSSPVRGGGSSRSSDREEYRTRLSDERRLDAKFADPADELVRRSYASDDGEEYRRGNSRTRTSYDYDDRDRRPPDDVRRDYRDDDKLPPRRTSDDDEYRRSRPRGDYDSDRTRYRDRYDKDFISYDRDDDRFVAKDDIPAPSRKYDRYPGDDDRPIRSDSDETGLRKEAPIRDILPDDRPVRSRPDKIDERSVRPVVDPYPPSNTGENRRYVADSGRSSGSSRPGGRETLLGSSMTSVYSREPSDVITREKRYQNTPESPSNGARKPVLQDLQPREDTGISSVDRGERIIVPRPPKYEPEDTAMRPLSAKDVIEAALRESDVSEQNSGKVSYPVFDPRVSNLTSPEIIRPSERRGTIITAKRRKRTIKG